MEAYVRTSRLSLLAVLLAWVGSNVCAQAPPPQVTAASLSGTSWQLVKFQSSDDKTLMPDDRTKYTVAFGSDGRVSVRIDCNRGNGSWKSGGPNQLQFGPLALTRAMCPPAPLNDRIPKDWEYVRSYTIKNGRLFLSLMADGGIYEFEPFNEAETPASSPVAPNRNSAPSLENTYWKLTYLGKAAVTVASQQREPHLVFSSESHRVSGSGGCNSLTGSYEVKGDELTFSQMASTMMACPEGMDTEKAFLKALEEVRTWKVTKRKLQLFDAGGNVIASFEARDVK
jgi:heat shock protein HslJ